MPDAPSPAETAEPVRTLVFEGCVNFRDLGGYRTADGRRLQWRRLFRADGLSKLTDADHRQLTDLGVASTVSPSTRSSGVKVTSAPGASPNSSTRRVWPSATRSCLPPVLITAYIGMRLYTIGRPAPERRGRSGRA